MQFYRCGSPFCSARRCSHPVGEEPLHFGTLVEAAGKYLEAATVVDGLLGLLIIPPYLNRTLLFSDFLKLVSGSIAILYDYNTTLDPIQQPSHSHNDFRQKSRSLHGPLVQCGKTGDPKRGRPRVHCSLLQVHLAFLVLLSAALPVHCQRTIQSLYGFLELFAGSNECIDSKGVQYWLWGCCRGEPEHPLPLQKGSTPWEHNWFTGILVGY